MKKGLILAGIIIVLDQITKYFVLKHFATNPAFVEVTPFFNLVLAWNKGVSFSLFYSNSAYMPYVFIGISLVICAIIVHWMKMESDPKTVLFFGMILGGALGNVIDRLHYGAVLDFLDFHVKSYHWPAFNVADSAICIGAFSILFLNIFLIPTPNKD